MSDDQNNASDRDRHSTDQLRAPDLSVRGASQSDDEELRSLFHATAPSASRVDVEALFRAALLPQRNFRSLAWSRSIGWSRELFQQITRLSPRRITMPATLKIAAAVLVAVGGFFYFSLIPSIEARAFAEAAQQLRNAHTLSYLTSTESPDLKVPMTMRIRFKEPSFFRAETDGGVITVIDAGQRKQLIIDSAAKTALLLEGKAAEAPGGPAGVGLVEHLRQLTTGDAKPVGEKRIGDAQARGYLVKYLGTDMTIWVNPATRLPVRIESVHRVQGKEIRITLSDFQIDAPFDDALFRVLPPQGYALNKAESSVLDLDEKTFLNPENATAGYLRIFAEKTGGTFPKRIDDLSEFDAVFPKKQKLGALPDAEMLRVVQAAARFMMATQTLKGGFGYKSEGIKLGDAHKILFWYRPEGAADYRAIYGDLHVADVNADNLPEKPKP
jgi:outer membrane lipoprotein-sorting protein